MNEVNKLGVLGSGMIGQIKNVSCNVYCERVTGLAILKTTNQLECMDAKPLTGYITSYCMDAKKRTSSITSSYQ